MAIDQQNNSIKALLNLLEDEDNYVSTMAMERLLSSGVNVNLLVAEFQESHDPILRSRIHQLGIILKRRQLRSEFVKKIKNSSMTLWEGILQINFQYNQKMDVHQVKQSMLSLADRTPRRLSTPGLAEFMRNENFAFAGDDIVGSDIYLIEDVLLHRVGSPILLSAIAKQLAKKRNLKVDIVLYKGRYCVMDRVNNLIDPSADWKLTHLNSGQDYRPYDKLNVWLALLCQLFTSAMLEGRLQAIHRVSSLLAEICDEKVRRFPFPLGS